MYTSVLSVSFEILFFRSYAQTASAGLALSLHLVRLCGMLSATMGNRLMVDSLDNAKAKGKTVSGSPQSIREKEQVTYLASGSPTIPKQDLMRDPSLPRILGLRHQKVIRRIRRINLDILPNHALHIRNEIDKSPTEPLLVHALRDTDVRASADGD
jgi:hypothetical protein